MRKATLIVTALLAVLALSVGALAYPVVVGVHPFATVHPAAPATASHPRGDDNSTGNQTNDNETGDRETPPAGNESDNETGDNETAPPVPPSPEGNETENESEMNVSVEHNVTVVQADNTTWINGTIVVTQGNVTLVDVTFQIVVHDNGTANVTFDGTQTVGSMVISVHGVAVFESDSRTLVAFGTATASQNGTVQWTRTFGFELPLSDPVRC